MTVRRVRRYVKTASALLALFAVLSVSQAVVQAQTNYNGTSTFNSITNNYGAVYVGYGASGTATFNGSTITSQPLSVGRTQSYNFVSSGNGGYYQPGSTPGTGTLNLQNGTTWNTNGFLNSIGIGRFESGTINLSGGSSLTTGWSDVGESGTGLISVTGGSHLITGASGPQSQNNTAGSTLGYFATGNGTLSVSGVNSTSYTYGSQFIGLNGTGALNVSNSGTATTQGTNFVGSSNYSNLYGVPPSINGSISVQTGGQVSAGNTTLGYASNGYGTVTVDGGGSKLTSVGTTTVGFLGHGTLTVQNGGLATATTNNLAGGYNGRATVLVTGPGSTLNATSSNQIGNGGTASLTIQNGGLVTAQTNLVSSSSGQFASVIVAGPGSTLRATSANYIGNGGTAQVTVQNGGLVTGQSNYIGYSGFNANQATVDGAGSKLISSGTTVVGHFGYGNLTIQNGGFASAQTTTVGAFHGSNGTVKVLGAGSTLQTTDLFIGGSSTNGQGGFGSVTVDHGGTLVANGVTVMFSTGALSITNGTFINNGAFYGYPPNPGSLVLGSNAVLAGTGIYHNINVNVANGVTLAPGNSPGTMTFNANQTWGGGGNLDFQILNLAGVAGTDWDKIVISGNLNITATSANPFLINLSSLSAPSTNGLLAGFDPYSSYQWLFLTAGSISGFNANSFLIDTAGFLNPFAGGSFGLHQDGNSLYLDYFAAVRPVDGPVTPEPTSLALAGFAGLGIAAGAWRRRRTSGTTRAV